MKLKVLLTIFVTMTSFQLLGKVRIDGVKFSKVDSSTGQFEVKLNKELLRNPELMIRDNIVQVAIPNSVVWPKIERKKTLVGHLDTTLLSYQFNKELTRTRVMLPYSVEKLKDQVNVVLREKSVIVRFPIVKTAQKVVTPLISKVVPKKKKMNLAYDESYLEKLLMDKSETKKDEPKKKGLILSDVKEDKVKMALSSVQKEPISPIKENKFSVTSYVWKFIAFMLVALAGFFGVMNLLRKGAMKKGKLGFLNKTKMIDVLSTTYVGPKKQLLTVRVHNQIFLLGSSDKGLHFLSEISDANGFIKAGEREVSGTNFDTNLQAADKEGKNFALKEFITSGESETLDPLASLVSSAEQQGEKVKLSQQIKNKVKGLKSLQ